MTLEAIRGELGLDRLGEQLDLLVEEVQVGEDRPDQERVVCIKATLERFAQRCDLRAHPALGQIGQDLGVSRARNERVEHRPPRDAEDVGGDAVELDPGVLERFMQAIGLALSL
jgi:hypothetical protein